MRKFFFSILFLFLLKYPLIAQSLNPEDYGFRHFQLRFRQDTVDILVLSKKGEEEKAKPVILFEKGSGPIPLIILADDGKPYGIMPFKREILSDDYHLVFISKPAVPLVVLQKDLGPNNFYYADLKNNLLPAGYAKRNIPEYYIPRDIAVIKYLKKRNWVDKKKLVLAGHSEGGRLVAQIASVSRDVTHVIYSNANPFGRMMTIISQIRANDDSVGTYAEKQFEFYETVIQKKNDLTYQPGDTYKNIYAFSKPPIDYLRKLKIPVLITYGTKDAAAPFQDYLRLEAIREGKKNFTFMPYPGVEHNYFGLKPNGRPDYDKFGWDKVALDWKTWLRTH